MMKIVIVGAGKLANAILGSELEFPDNEIVAWNDVQKSLNERAIIVHAGSGRQLIDCLEFCKRTDSIFIELSTGLETEKIEAEFTLILCPNTSLLLLKVMHMLSLYGHHFAHNKITITESHQSTKSSVPGTAFSLAKSLKMPTDKIRSIREPKMQLEEIGIPVEFLDKHAYHKIEIEDGKDSVTIETKVLGHRSYASGVKKILEAVLNHPLERRKYSVLDLIDKGIL
jgi:4-hydroxy-tetrahydrodipicolinate reductase